MQEINAQNTRIRPAMRTAIKGGGTLILGHKSEPRQEIAWNSPKDQKVGGLYRLSAVGGGRREVVKYWSDA